MKVRLLKKHTPHSRELPIGTEMEVDNDKGRLWVEKKIAIEIKGLTKSEKRMNRMIKDENEKAAQQEAEHTISVEDKLTKKNKKQ